MSSLSVMINNTIICPLHMLYIMLQSLRASLVHLNSLVFSPALGQPVYRHSCKLKPLQCFCENSLSSMSEGLEGHDLDAKHSRMLFAAVLINSLSHGVYIMIVHGEI
jgi:hypothetical protein